MTEKKLLVATRNPGKIEELKVLLSGLDLTVVGLEILPAAIADCPETGKSFCANARLKAEYWFAHSGLPALADDSGLAVDALGGAPGVYSARFAGERATDRQNLKLLLRRLKGVARPARTAAFHCCLALRLPAGGQVTFKGSCRGFILDKEAGANGFGYDPVFFYPPLGHSFAELSREAKNQVSHRGQALQALREWLTMHPL